MNKKAFEMSFAWIFAIIVGAFILVMSVYGIVKFMGTEKTAINAEIGEQIGILFNPLETGFGESQSTSFKIPGETRIYNKCEKEGSFGKQTIPVVQQTFGKWTKTDVEPSFYNKYIFSENYVEGRNFYIFSSSLDFPFKVADLIFLSSENEEYCFKNPPEEIKNLILGLGQENMKVDNCTAKSKVVCSSGNCEIYVDLDNGYVKKDNDKLYFVLPEEKFSQKDYSLMYGAIFSSPEVYECQIQRLLKRTENLAKIYNEKASIVEKKGCNSNLNLIGLINACESIDSSAELDNIILIVDEMRERK